MVPPGFHSLSCVMTTWEASQIQYYVTSAVNLIIYSRAKGTFCSQNFRTTDLPILSFFNQHRMWNQQ
jgi:hypothetical protein